MPDWAMQLLVAGGGLAALVAAVGKLFNVVHSAWLAKEAQIVKLQDKVESLLMDAKARAEDDKAERAERLAMDAKQNELAATTTAALKEATAIMAQIKRGNP